MTEDEKIEKIKEIQAKFMEDLRALDKERNEKIKAIKKGIDERRINSLKQSMNI